MTTPVENERAVSPCRQLRVLATGPLATIQDLGRPGFEDLGVSPSGAADPYHLRLANRLVGNVEDAAAVEITLGNFAAVADSTFLIAVTGAAGKIRVGRRSAAANTHFYLRAGEELRLDTPADGLRSYLAVRGGLDVPPTLGSRCTDTLSGLGPAPLAPGDVLPIGTPTAPFPAAALAPQPPPAQHVVLAALPGPRADWFTEEALASLYTSRYQVSQHTDRIGMRLIGPPLTRRHDRELVSEPTVAGALQVPPDGQPILFLADHPVTGGYPVVAVVDYVDIAGAAQLRPGQYVSFTPPGRFATW